MLNLQQKLNPRLFDAGVEHAPVRKWFGEDYLRWGKLSNKEEAAMALKELRTLGGKIKSEHQ